MRYTSLIFPWYLRLSNDVSHLFPIDFHFSTCFLFFSVDRWKLRPASAWSATKLGHTTGRTFEKRPRYQYLATAQEAPRSSGFFGNFFGQFYDNPKNGPGGLGAAEILEPYLMMICVYCTWIVIVTSNTNGTLENLWSWTVWYEDFFR